MEMRPCDPALWGRLNELLCADAKAAFRVSMRSVTDASSDDEHVQVERDIFEFASGDDWVFYARAVDSRRGGYILLWSMSIQAPIRGQPVSRDDALAEARQLRDSGGCP
jgi:hypothetical protein